MNSTEAPDLGGSHIPSTTDTYRPRRRRTQETSPGSRLAPWPGELAGFTLSNYEGTARYTPADWACQFHKRFVLRNALTSGAEDQRGHVEQWMPGLLADPLAPYLYGKGSASLMQAKGSVEPGPQHAVRDLTVRDLRRLLEQLPPDVDNLSAIDHVFHRQGLELGEDGQPVGNALGSFFHAIGDLSAPDNVLMERFKLRLQEARDRAGRPELYKHKNSSASLALHNHYREAETWRHFNVLPYVDIELTALYRNIPMPSNLLLLDRLNPSKSATHLPLVKKHVNDCLTLPRIHELLLT